MSINDHMRRLGRQILKEQRMDEAIALIAARLKEIRDEMDAGHERHLKLKDELRESRLTHAEGSPQDRFIQWRHQRNSLEYKAMRKEQEFLWKLQAMLRASRSAA